MTWGKPGQHDLGWLTRRDEPGEWGYLVDAFENPVACERKTRLDALGIREGVPYRAKLTLE